MADLSQGAKFTPRNSSPQSRQRERIVQRGDARVKTPRRARGRQGANPRIAADAAPRGEHTPATV